MFKLVSVVVVVMAVIGTPVTTDVPPAGKCKDVTPVPFEFNKLKLEYSNWHLIFVPDDEAFADMDSEWREVFSTSPNMVTNFITIRTKNNTESRYTFKLIYGNDFAIYEEARDENDKIYQFKWIPLAVVNKCAVFYYRCSDNGSVSIDTRFIVAPKSCKLSRDQERVLLEEDKKHKFVSRMRKLRNKFV